MLRKGQVEIQHSITIDDPQEDTRVFPRTIVLDLDITANIEHESAHTEGPPEECYPSSGEIEIVEVLPTFYSVDGNESEYNEKDFYDLTGATLKYIREQWIDKDELYDAAKEML